MLSHKNTEILEYRNSGVQIYGPNLTEGYFLGLIRVSILVTRQFALAGFNMGREILPRHRVNVVFADV